MPSQSQGHRSTFEHAALCIVQGDEIQLKQLLKASPSLIHQRAKAAHKATLLHYIAANGVEDELQRSPANAANIAQILLDAGAEVDALAQSYGGGSAQTPLSLLVSSFPPAKAGVQAALVKKLIDAGANINGLDNNGGPIATAIAFGYLPAATMLAQQGARVDCVQIAAALGDLHRFNRFFDSNGKLNASAGVNQSQVVTSTDDPSEALSVAFWYACLHSQIDIARQLLNKGADINYKDKEGFTALHGASVRGETELVTLLLDSEANTEVTNDYGGTVLDTLCWFATNIRDDRVDYHLIAKQLLNNGANAAAISPYPTHVKLLDDLIAPYRV